MKWYKKYSLKILTLKRFKNNEDLKYKYYYAKQNFKNAPAIFPYLCVTDAIRFFHLLAF